MQIAYFEGSEGEVRIKMDAPVVNFDERLLSENSPWSLFDDHTYHLTEIFIWYITRFWVKKWVIMMSTIH